METTALAPEPDDAQVLTPGTMLRRAREAQGLHIAALAVSLKVPVKKLEALEGDRYDQLPDAVFVRALASSVCRTLRVDPAPVLARLPRNAGPRLAHNASGINAPFRAPGDGPSPSLWDQISRPAVLAVFGLLIAAVVLVFLPDIQRFGNFSAAAPDAAAMPPAVAASDAVMPPGVLVESVVPAEVASAALNSRPVTSAPAAATATQAPAMSLSPSVALSTPTVSSPTLVITPPAVAAAAASGIVVFTARVQSWVEVTDARGAVPLRKILVPGEAVAASGALPLSVIVGKADSTQVQVRGRPLDLAPLSRDNVARFEVK
ncbi:MAG: helix-turn-helix domain-containing protein [Bdellovibrionales bacterium]|nr:helix-turn-helix domain-containing protein [Ramlibacter sp.]